MQKFVVAVVCIVISCMVIYGGITLFYAFWPQTENTYNKPSVKKAMYSARIINTGLTFYADNGEKTDGIVEMKEEYWELRDGNYKKIDGDLMLDESIFGPVRLTVRN